MIRYNAYIIYGFTIVELVVVIILIGILTVVALPRFIDVDEEARLSAAQNTAGNFLDAVNVVHSEWLVDGRRPTSLVFDGVTLQFNNNGWPKTQVSNTADCIDVWNGVFIAPEPISPYLVNATPPGWSAIGFATGCLYVYQYGQAFTAANQLPFFVYIPDTTGTQILRFNM